MTNTTWDPLDTDPGLSLSGGNLVGTGTGVSRVIGSRAIDGKLSGKFYFEVTVSSGTASGHLVGVGLGGPGWAGYVTNHGACVMVQTDSGGKIYNNGTDTGKTLGAFSAGNVVCVAADFDNSKIWIRKDAGNWNGTAGDNPATNTGGQSISGMITSTELFFPILGGPSGSVAVRTANFGNSAFSQSVPSGFTSGWTSNSSNLGSTWDSASNQWPNLINNNLTVSGSTGSSIWDRSVHDHNNGKYYVEFFIAGSNEGISLTEEIVGVANNSYNNTGTGRSTDAAGIGFTNTTTGTIYINGSSSGVSLGSVAHGNTISMAIDIGSNLIWFRLGKASNAWNSSGNPITGSGGLDISSITDSTLKCIATNHRDSLAYVSFGSFTNLKINPSTFLSNGWNLGWPTGGVVPGLPIRAPFTIPGGIITVPFIFALGGITSLVGNLKENKVLSRRKMLFFGKNKR